MRVDDLKSATFPIPYDESWGIISPSKMDTYRDCPRQFFWEDVVGWHSTRPNNHLHFGKSWHKAKEYLLRNIDPNDGYHPEVVLAAFDKFVEEYRKEFDEETDEYFKEAGGKTPKGAFKALATYAKQCGPDDRQYKTLYTEVAMVISLAEDAYIHCRADSILERLEDGKKFARDHKTGSRLDSKWKDKWIMNTGIGTYNHALYSLYPIEEVGGVEIDGTFFRRLKTKGYLNEHWRGTFHKTPDQMQHWLWNTLTWYEDIMRNFEWLTECNEDQPIMDCFPTNDNSCTKYFGCQYLDFCSAWPNPLRRCQEPPMGFEVRYWDTRKDETAETMKF